MTAAAIGGVVGLALCGFLGFWLFGFASQHVDKLLPQWGDLGSASVSAQPSTLRADLERWLASNDFRQPQQIAAMTDRLSGEFQRMSGSDALESVKLAYSIGKQIFLSTDDPDLTKAAWNLAQAAYSQLFRATVDTGSLASRPSLKPIADFLERLAEIGDRRQSYDSLSSRASTLDNEAKTRSYELARSLSSSLLESDRSRESVLSDSGHWIRALWITRDLIEVACYSSQTTGIATDLVLLCEHMEQVSNIVETYEREARRGNTNLSAIAHIAPDEPPTPPKPVTADTPWGVRVYSMFASRSETNREIESLFPEAKWRLSASNDGTSYGFSTFSSACAINGEQVTLDFHSSGYEKRLLYFVHVDNQAEFLTRLKNYRTRSLDQAGKWITIDLNLPRRKAQ